MIITILSDEEKQLKQELEKRPDFESRRMSRYLSMHDLSRTPGSPLKEIIDRASAVDSLKGFDVIKVPEIVPVNVLFDLFNMPPDHPARSKSDTYYVNDDYVLRTHDTVFWYYYLNHPEIKERIKNNESFGAICHGKVFRKDEIDRHHMNVFHHMGGLYLVPDSKKTLALDDLKNALLETAKSIFGPDIKYRFNVDIFPY